MKQKILDYLTSHPKPTTLAFGLTITAVIGTALGMMAPHLAFAGGACTSCGSQ